jgi:hypothetical protein
VTRASLAPAWLYVTEPTPGQGARELLASSTSRSPIFRSGHVAEGVGFEPTRREVPPTRFPVARTRPNYATLPGCELDCGGEGGIRTHGGFDTSLLFESSTFNHSDTSPSRSIATAMAIPQTKKPRAINGSRFSICTPGRIRTCDLLVRNQTLYPLSYGRIGWLAYAFHNQRMIAKRLKEGQPALQLIESSSGSFAIQVDTFGLHRYYPLSQVADRVREHV